ncbi:MAG: DUF1080 domain-containing protein, partial [Polyangiales bacterium]
PDGAIYVGGIGNPADWAQEHKLWYGLQRLALNGKPTFEMLDLQLTAEGIAITFTEPLRPGDGDAPEDYALKQWRYVPTASYGGPKVDEAPVAVRGVGLSADRRQVTLYSDAIRPDHVLHVHLQQPPAADSGREIWTTDAYCTVNVLPPSASNAAPAFTPSEPNRLSAAERDAGFALLFDGKTMQGWEGHAGAPLGSAWKVKDGVLRSLGTSGPDLVTRERFADFELELEWQVTPGANSGIFYRASEAQGPLWQAAAELQLLDDDQHADGQTPTHRAGSVYDLYPPRAAITRQVGEWNHARVVARGQHIEHWLNGHKLVEYDIGSPSWQLQLAASKFRNRPDFAAAASGRIGLQHHGSEVAYRNIKLRPL